MNRRKLTVLGESASMVGMQQGIDKWESATINKFGLPGLLGSKP